MTEADPLEVAADMKGGLAAILTVLTRAAAELAAGTVTALLVPDEEHASAGMRALTSALTFDAAVVVEDSGLRLGTAHAGHVTGYVGCASAAEHRASVAGLLAYARRGSGRLGFAADPTWPHAFAVRQSVPPGEDAHQIPAALRAALPGPAAAGMTCTVRESFQADPTDRWLRALTAAGRGRRLAMAQATLSGWTEAAVLATHGVSCVVFGPGGAGAHTSAESVDLRQVELTADVLHKAALSYCGSP
ncbi:MAG TPA: M20/M25/M40 family metallo-hydrolase [Mycobacterium sp.]|nr:M20/M25/M40 family metallo-hydrolase [Mycobacterium sp.]